MSFLTPTVAHWRYLLMSPKRADPSAASESVDVNPYAIDSLITQSWKHRVSAFFFPNFGVNTCPPNFGIKIILFQNYHICTSIGSAVTGRESWSGAYYPLPSPTYLPAHEPIPQKFHESITAFIGAWIYSSRSTINVCPTLVRATQQLSYVSLMLASSSALGSARPSMV